MFFFLALFSPVSSQACKCANAPTGSCADLLKDNVAFLGTVDDVEKIHGISDGDRERLERREISRTRHEGRLRHSNRALQSTATTFT